jgi:anti-sigma factor RsiW
MCDFSGKLIAWMDGELPEGEATTIERHLQACADCRDCLAKYRETSGGFAAYCDAAIEPFVAEPRRGVPPWLLAAAGTAAVAALLLVLPKHGAQSPAALTGHLVAGATPATHAQARPVAAPAPASAPEFSATQPKPVKAKSSERGLASNLEQSPLPARVPVRSAASAPPGPSIEIAIPSDAMFPPGAMPDGMSFVANVTLGADGSAERLRLEPQLVEFERKATRP